MNMLFLEFTLPGLPKDRQTQSTFCSTGASLAMSMSPQHVSLGDSCEIFFPTLGLFEPLTSGFCLLVYFPFSFYSCAVLMSFRVFWDYHSIL